jgi:hypothetical protein
VFRYHAVAVVHEFLDARKAPGDPVGRADGGDLDDDYAARTQVVKGGLEGNERIGEMLQGMYERYHVKGFRGVRVQVVFAGLDIGARNGRCVMGQAVVKLDTAGYDSSLEAVMYEVPVAASNVQEAGSRADFRDPASDVLEAAPAVWIYPGPAGREKVVDMTTRGLIGRWDGMIFVVVRNVTTVIATT